MLESHHVEELIQIVTAMDRDSLIERMLHFRGTFPVDFSREFLERLPVDRLRHILVALCVQCSVLPTAEIPAAAA